MLTALYTFSQPHATYCDSIKDLHARNLRLIGLACPSSLRKAEIHTRAADSKTDIFILYAQINGQWLEGDDPECD